LDAENRLISVAAGGATTQFIYDGDGNLVKKIKPDGSKTIYVRGIYEVDKNSGGTVVNTKTYYPAAGATLAPARTPVLAYGARECRCASW
jgi:YD repeat-containing protein